MTATTSTSQPITQRKTQTGYPAGSLRFDWAMIGLSALFLAGLWVDGWAHFHGNVDGSFFTPWHLLFYSSFALIALFLGVNQLRNTGKGYAFAKSLPKGYWLSLVGVVTFAVGGVGDMIWHTLFGIEAGTEALMSPTHILLGIGMGLIFTGPVRSAYFRYRHQTASGWRDLGPLVVGITLLTTLIMFFSSYANPVVTPQVNRGRANVNQDFGVTGILLTAAVYAGMTILLTQRWRTPFGAFTLLFGVSTAMLTILNDVYVLIIPAVVTGLVVDVLVLWLRPSGERLGRFLTVAFVAPTLYFALYFVTASQIVRVLWSIHVWTGTVFISGVIGLLMAFLVYSASREANTDDA